MLRACYQACLGGDRWVVTFCTKENIFFKKHGCFELCKIFEFFGHGIDVETNFV